MNMAETPSLGIPDLRIPERGRNQLNDFGNFDVSKQGGLVRAWIKEVYGRYLSITDVEELTDIINMIDRVLNNQDKPVEDNVKEDLENLRREVLSRKGDLLVKD